MTQQPRIAWLVANYRSGRTTAATLDGVLQERAGRCDRGTVPAIPNGLDWRFGAQPVIDRHDPGLGCRPPLQEIYLPEDIVGETDTLQFRFSGLQPAAGPPADRCRVPCPGQVGDQLRREDVTEPSHECRSCIAFGSAPAAPSIRCIHRAHPLAFRQAYPDPRSAPPAAGFQQEDAGLDHRQVRPGTGLPAGPGSAVWTRGVRWAPVTTPGPLPGPCRPRCRAGSGRRPAGAA
jgi:hypothetical protein